MFWFGLHIMMGQFAFGDTSASSKSASDLSVDEANTLIDNSIATVFKPVRMRSGPLTYPCPQPFCQRLRSTDPGVYNDTLLGQGEWLAMANTYGVGPSVLPTLGEEQTQRFVHWDTGERGLTILIESKQPVAFFTTWSLDALKPTDNPFDYTRLAPLWSIRDSLFQKCDHVEVVDRDARLNPIAWQGTDCGEWTLWMRYTPLNEAALSVMGLRK